MTLQHLLRLMRCRRGGGFRWGQKDDEAQKNASEQARDQIWQDKVQADESGSCPSKKHDFDMRTSGFGAYHDARMSGSLGEW